MEQDDLSNSSTEKYNKEVEKLNSTISKLEKNLKYAKAEQAGFTKKTSELTKTEKTRIKSRNILHSLTKPKTNYSS